MGNKLNVKIITKSGKAHILSVTLKEYAELQSLINGNENYMVIKVPTGDVILKIV